jgi:hypothetical protein
MNTLTSSPCAEVVARRRHSSTCLVDRAERRPLLSSVLRSVCRLSIWEPRLSEGALVVADNADWCPEYLARVRDPGGGYASVPFASDVEVSMRLGGRVVAV